jgi:P-type conjugative transfer protein TrbJ
VADGTIKAAAEARWLNSVEALKRSLGVQASVIEAMARTEAEAGALIDRSQGAAGGLQAAQAGNQLLALQSKQLADLTALLAAQGQAQALEQARAAAAAADAKAHLRRFLARQAP